MVLRAGPAVKPEGPTRTPHLAFCLGFSSQTGPAPAHVAAVGGIAYPFRAAALGRRAALDYMRAIWVALRVMLGVGGGYAASAAGSAALAVALYRLAGFDPGESAVLCTSLGFAFYLFTLLWALTAPSLARVALMLACGAFVGYGVVHWLSPVAISSPIPLGIGV